jgi:hypothetical protein
MLYELLFSSHTCFAHLLLPDVNTVKSTNYEAPDATFYSFLLLLIGPNILSILYSEHNKIGKFQVLYATSR